VRPGTRGPVPLSIAERIARRVERDEHGCLVWLGGRDPKGYGRMTIGSTADGSRRCMLVHRAAWEHVHGPIPAGMVVMHRCDNPPCCDVEHLQLGTVAENNRDAWAKGRARSWIAEALAAGWHPRWHARPDAQ
jgi:hypothetical protein